MFQIDLKDEITFSGWHDFLLPLDMKILPNLDIMKNLVEKLKVFFFATLNIPQQVSEGNINLIKARKKILQELTLSKDSGRVIGIYSDVLGQGMFLASVDDVFKVDKEQIIVLKPYDLHGVYLQRTHLSLDEIISVCPFNIVYANPLTRKTKELAY